MRSKSASTLSPHLIHTLCHNLSLLADTEVRPYENEPAESGALSRPRPRPRPRAPVLPVLPVLPVGGGKRLLARAPVDEQTLVPPSRTPSMDGRGLITGASHNQKTFAIFAVFAVKKTPSIRAHSRFPLALLASWRFNTSRAARYRRQPKL